MKSEPDTFSFQDLKNRPKQREPWDGVRNYQARNFMRDTMSVGDRVLFYHCNTEPPGIVGIDEIVSDAYPDPTAFNKKSKYYDPKSNPEQPRWFLVDVAYVADFQNMLTLEQMKEMPELSEMKVLQRGNRLSITPVSESEYRAITSYGLKKA